MWSQIQNAKVKYTERYKLNGKYKTVSITYDKDTARNRKEASDLLRMRINEALAVKDSGDTLKCVYEAYMKYQEAHVRPSTLFRNRNVLKKTIELMGDVHMNDLTAGYIREHLPDDVPTLYNTRLTRLKALIRWAYINDKIDDINFLVKLKPMPTDYKEKVAEKYLEKRELQCLLNGMKLDRWRLVTEFLALSGVRIGELLALRPEDVGDVIRISKTYIVQLHKVSPFTKTDSSTREVYVQSELKPVIQALRKYSDRTHFCYFKYDAYRKYLAENSERILGRKISPHALRHTMTSLMAGEGIPLEVISRRLGHSDSDITKRVYFHVVEQLKDRDAKLIEHVKLL